MILDFRQYREPAVVLIATAIALGCYGLLINAAFGRHDRWLLERDHSVLGLPPIEIGARRILGIVRDRADSPGQADYQLGVLVGASTLECGVDPDSLSSQLGGRYRWSNLVVAGYPTEYNTIVRLMYRHGVNPAAMVVVMNPSTLLPGASFEEERPRYDPALLRQHLTGFRLGHIKNDLVAMTLAPWNLSFPYRGQVFTLVDRSFLAAKLSVLDWLGMGLGGLYAPDPNPWYEDGGIELRYGPATTEEAKQEFLKGLENKGWFDPTRYRADGPNFALLLDIFRLAHAHGTRTFIAFVPESKRFRDRLPPESEYHLTHTLRKSLGPAAPVFLDFRTIAAEDQFHDPSHVNRAGKEHLTRSLAGALKPYLEIGNSAPDSGRE
jgi:hypothetical protein